MGFAPQVVDRMTVWQFHAALKGWKIANGQQEPDLGEISNEELRAMGVVGF
jgi:hypothetical protein